MNRCLLIATLLLCTSALATDGWDLAYDREGIRVYLKDPSATPYQQFRGVSTMKASVRTLTGLQDNLRVACKWLYACDQMRLLDVEGDSTWVYLTTNPPWPTRPRDIVLKVTSERLADGTLVRHLSAEPDRIPKVDGLIRVRHLSGKWRMKPLGERVTEVTYQLQAAPAGDAPSWLANRFMVDTAVVTLRTLRAVAERQP